MENMMLTPASGISIALALALGGAALKLHSIINKLQTENETHAQKLAALGGAALKLHSIINKLQTENETHAQKLAEHDKWIDARKLEIAHERGVQRGRVEPAKPAAPET